MARLFNDASSEYARYVGALINTQDAHTYAGWFYCDDASNVGTLIASHSSAAVPGYTRLVLVGTQSPKQLRANAAADGGGGQGNATVTAWAANTWHHAAGVFTSSTSRTVYLDGSSASNTDAITTTATPTETALGYVNGAGPAPIQYFSGRLGEWGLWSVSLTANEVTALARGASPLLVRPESLVAYWPLFGRASPEPDRIGSYPLTLSGTAQSAHPRIILPGRPQLYIVGAAGGATITTATLPAGVGALGSGQTRAILPAGVGYMG